MATKNYWPAKQRRGSTIATPSSNRTLSFMAHLFDQHTEQQMLCFVRPPLFLGILVAFTLLSFTFILRRQICYRFHFYIFSLKFSILSISERKKLSPKGKRARICSHSESNFDWTLSRQLRGTMSSKAAEEVKNTIKAGGSTATKCWLEGLDWIPLRLLWLLEHLRC